MEQFLPQNIKKTLPALLAMFFVSSTFSMYNLTLLANVMDYDWSNSYLGLLFNVNFTAAITIFSLLLVKPKISLNRRFIFGITLFISVATVILFLNQQIAYGWLVFFLFQGAYGTFWHQNVRLTLLDNASENEYARTFGLYMLMNLIGNFTGASLYEIFDNTLYIMSFILIAYALACICLMRYPVYQGNEEIEKGFTKAQFNRCIEILRTHPLLWCICLISGYMGESFFIFISTYLEGSGVDRNTSLSAITAFLLGGILAKYPLSYLMDVVGKYSVSILIILATIALNIALLSIQDSYYMVLLLACLLGAIIFSLTIVGDTMVATFVGKKEQHDASTLSIVVYFMGGLLGNAFVGTAMDAIGLEAFPITTISLALIMGLSLIVLRRHAKAVSATVS